MLLPLFGSKLGARVVAVAMMTVVALAVSCGSAWASRSPFWPSFQIDHPQPEMSPGSLSGVSCPTTRLCVAVDDQGNVISSTDPAGGSDAWSGVSIDRAGAPDAVSCAPSGLCAISDAVGNVLVSADPAGGQGAWKVNRLSDRPISDVSCPASGLCVAVDSKGNVLVSTEPQGAASTWATTPVTTSAHPLLAVSCPTVSFCAAVSAHGEVATSTDPAGGPGAWKTIRLDDSLGAISCPSADFCAVAGFKDVLTSADPTGGASAWKATRLPNENNDENSLLDISCPIAKLCVVTDEAGDVVASTAPTGGRRMWISSLITGDPRLFLLTGLSCASIRLCVAVDRNGSAYVSTNPAGPVVRAIRPHLSGSLTGIAKRKPRLRFTVTAGIPPAHAVKKVKIAPPAGIHFSNRDLAGSVVVNSPRGKPLKATVAVRRGKLLIAPKTAVTKARITIVDPVLSVSRRLARRVKHSRIPLTSVAMATDTHGTTTRLAVRTQVSLYD